MRTITCVLYSVLFVCLVCFAGCSSSSGGGDDVAGGESLSLSMPTILNYSVSEYWSIDNDLMQASVGGLTISVIEGPDWDGQPAINMTGTFNSETEETTLSSGSGMWIDTGGFFEDELYKKMVVYVPEGVIVKWVGEDNPTEGEFIIELRPPDGNFPGYVAILITVNPYVDGLGPGVDISTLENMSSDPVYQASFTWDDFEDLDDEEEAEDYQKVSSFCYGVWQTVFERVGNCFETIVLLHENSVDLSATGSMSISLGDNFSLTGTGSAECSWTDASADGEMGPGDNFTLTMTNVWEDDENDNIDDMYNGSVHFYLLASNVDEDRGVLDSIGGDFVFENLIIQETEDNALDPEGVVTFNGGFNFHIWE